MMIDNSRVGDAEEKRSKAICTAANFWQPGKEGKKDILRDRFWIRESLGSQVAANRGRMLTIGDGEQQTLIGIRSTVPHYRSPPVAGMAAENVGRPKARLSPDGLRPYADVTGD